VTEVEPGGPGTQNSALLPKCYKEALKYLKEVEVNIFFNGPSEPKVKLDRPEIKRLLLSAFEDT
jgi:hypothetical protein